MSTEQGSWERSSQEGTRTPPLGAYNPEQSGKQPTQSKPTSTQQELGEQREPLSSDQQHALQSAQSSVLVPVDPDVVAPSTSEEEHEKSPRQVIAVSASKGPAAFFNLARKFLATDEMCDLSALEGAIVSAVDAAHLLERSQLATIVRVNTSYVTVEPKRRKHPKEQEGDTSAPSQSQSPVTSAASGSQDILPATPPSHVAETTELVSSGQERTSPPREGTPPGSRQSGGRSSGRELRRARIVITVRRTASYKRWLEENPLQAIIASEGDADTALEEAPVAPKQPE